MAVKKKPVDKPATPLNERAGRCSNCARAAFGHRIAERVLQRICRGCGEIMNADDMTLIAPGDPAMKWSVSK